MQDKHTPLNKQRYNSTSSMLLLRVEETFAGYFLSLLYFAENHTSQSCTQPQILLSTCTSLLAPHQWTTKAIMRHHLVHPVFIFLCRCCCATQQSAQPRLISDIVTHSIKEFLDCRKPRKCQCTCSVWMTHMR